ncbi:MAG TPA: ATP-binding protein, partial [Burkholderiaceae bacterium]
TESDDLNKRLLDIELPVTMLGRTVFAGLMRQTLVRRQGEILVVVGDSGSGKSHLRQQLERDAKALFPDPKETHRCISVVLDSSANLLALTRQIARKYGNPVTMNKILDKTSRDISFEVLEDIERLRTVVIFFDEAHNMRFLEPRGKDKERDDPMAMWLKNLTYLGVSLVFFALPEFMHTVRRVRELNTRLYRDEPITTRGLTGTTDADIGAALKFLASVQAAHQVQARPAFSSPTIALPLIRATGGNLRKLMRLVHSAVDESRLRGSSQVEVADFEQAARLTGTEWSAL